MVATLTSIYFYSIVFEPPRIFYAVREQQRWEAEALELAEKKSNNGWRVFFGPKHCWKILMRITSNPVTWRLGRPNTDTTVDFAFKNKKMWLPVVAHNYNKWHLYTHIVEEIDDA